MNKKKLGLIIALCLLLTILVFPVKSGPGNNYDYKYSAVLYRVYRVHEEKLEYSRKGVVVYILWFKVYDGTETVTNPHWKG